jgi:hypothetical protein
VGGYFTSAGGVSANYVARFNTQTNTWSALGTGSQNGVSGVSFPVVLALAVVGNEVVVGGWVHLGGRGECELCGALQHATNTWSSLGTFSSNGVNEWVWALAVVGNEVYVGGWVHLGGRGECEPSGALQHADEHLVNARHGQ